MALADALESAGDSDEAIKYHTEAVDLASTVDVDLLDDRDQPSSVVTDSAAVKNHAQAGLSDIVETHNIVPESVIRDGVVCIIDQLDASCNIPLENKHFHPEVADTTTSIIEAERLVQETVRQTSSSATVVIDVFGVPEVTDTSRTDSTSGIKRNTTAANVLRVERKDQSSIPALQSAFISTDGGLNIQSRLSSQRQVPAATNGLSMSTESSPSRSRCSVNGTPRSLSSHDDRPTKGISGQLSGVVETTLHTTYNGHESYQPSNSPSTSLKAVLSPISSV